MASIPCSARHRISNMKELISSPITPSLQYFNTRMTQRLHRYRLLKRQWNEVATAIQIDSSFISKSESPLFIPEIIPVTHEQIINEYINSTKIKEKNSIELDPLHSQIEKDLIKLRKLIKVRQNKFKENVSSNNKPSGETIANDELEKNKMKKVVSLNQLNTLDQVKISGYQMRPATFPQTNLTDDRNVNTSNCSQYSKQKNINQIFNLYRNRVNNSLPSDSLIQGVPPPKKTPNTNIKQTQSDRIPAPPIIKKKQSSFIKQETPLPSIQRSLDIEQTTTCSYTYAASTSSATPSSMKLNRNASLLPILLTPNSCIGIQPRKSHSEKNDNPCNLLDYKHLITHLPKPLVPIHPRYDQGDYGILFKQLEHIRENMPDSNVYENYTRTY